jgi:deazaflavin-dependent oxidoreductase (nitroreductase family)
MKSADLQQLAKEEYCYLTTIGRVTGKPHRIEIWFGMDGSTAYLLSGGTHKSDWVRNLKKEPSIQVRIGERSFAGRARVVSGAEEEQQARQLLAAKYYNWRPGRRLNSWARTALPIALELDLN